MKNVLVLIFLIAISSGLLLITSLWLAGRTDTDDGLGLEDKIHVSVDAEGDKRTTESGETMAEHAVTASLPASDHEARLDSPSWGIARIANRYCDSVFFTIVRPGEFNHLRELVGSIHRWRPLASQRVPIIHIYGHRLQRREMDEIALWRNVILHNLRNVLAPAGIHDAESILDATADISTTMLDEKRLFEDDTLRHYLMSRVVEMHGHGIFLETGHVLWENKLDLIHERLVRDGHLALRASHDERTVCEAFVVDSTPYRCLVTARWSPHARRGCEGVGRREERSAALYGIDEAAPSDDDEEGHANSCQICLRHDAHHDWTFYKRPTSKVVTTEPERKTRKRKIQVALMIPTTSRGTREFWNLPFLSILLPTLRRSLSEEELQQYELSFYLGYDEGDRMYDDRRGLSQLVRKTRQTFAELGVPSIRMTFVRLGVSRSVTFIWNVLFALAVAEGADYFYQLNDDVRFVSAGWLSTLPTHLRRHQQDFGVVGPHDPAFGCRIMTQSMVSRKHWHIFGWYFPPDFRNWHCDTWLSLVYARWTRCFDKMIIWNGRYEKKGNLPRYRPCKKMEFRPLTLFYQLRLKNATGSIDPSHVKGDGAL